METEKVKIISFAISPDLLLKIDVYAKIKQMTRSQVLREILYDKFDNTKIHVLEEISHD